MRNSKALGAGTGIAAAPSQQREKRAMRLGCMLVVSALAMATSHTALAAEPQGKGASKPPVNSWGKPDFEGNWTNSSLTRLERDAKFGDRLEMNDAEVRSLEGERQATIARDGAKTDPNASAADVNSTCEVRGFTGGPACGYNGAWTDPGDIVMRVSGRPRTSFITTTPDGRVPPAKPGRAAQPRSVPAGMQQNDNPEGRSLGERCIMSFGFSSGPVMQPQLYNSNYQFIQTKDELAIMVEMVHDVRHIRIGGKHRTDGVRSWMGDSVGQWEGNTLVVETVNFHPSQNFRGASDKMKVTERFTRTSPDRIHYQFTVEDPATWEKPWGGEYEFGKSKGPLYEYACHEGNYGLENILAGARAEEAEAATKTASR